MASGGDPRPPFPLPGAPAGSPCREPLPGAAPRKEKETEKKRERRGSDRGDLGFNRGEALGFDRGEALGLDRGEARLGLGGMLCALKQRRAGQHGPGGLTLPHHELVLAQAA